MRKKTPAMRKLEIMLGRTLEEDLQALSPLSLADLALRWGVTERTLYDWLPRIGGGTLPQTLAVYPAPEEP